MEVSSVKNLETIPGESKSLREMIRCNKTPKMKEQELLQNQYDLEQSLKVYFYSF